MEKIDEAEPVRNEKTSPPTDGEGTAPHGNDPSRHKAFERLVQAVAANYAPPPEPPTPEGRPTTDAKSVMPGEGEVTIEPDEDAADVHGDAVKEEGKKSTKKNKKDSKTKDKANQASPPEPTPVSPPTTPPATPKTPVVPIALALMLSAACITVTVPVAKVAAFINDLGHAAKDAHFNDVQLWVQRRYRRRDDPVSISGLILDVDTKVADPLAAVANAGLPMPTCWWWTRHGFKLLYAFSHDVSLDTFKTIAEEFVIALAGADLASADISQAQHLPVVMKSTTEGVVDLNHPAVQTNGVSLSTDMHEPSLPTRIERLLTGSGPLSEGERETVEEYLDELGIPAPDDPGGRELYDLCPVGYQHDTKCAYVLRREDASIEVVCHGGHGGEGRKVWSERALYKLAGGDVPDYAGADASDIPMTWAGVALLRHQLTRALPQECQKPAFLLMAIRVWQRSVAFASIRRQKSRLRIPIEAVPRVGEFLRLYDERINGSDAAGAFRVFYSETTHVLCLYSPDGTYRALKIKGETLSEQTHLHEWNASLANRIEAKTEISPKTNTATIFVSNELDKSFSSHWNKVLIAHAPSLAAVGLPIISTYDLPVSFVEDDWQLDPVSKVVRVVGGCSAMGDPHFDAETFVFNLFKTGKLPLATEEDVKRLLMVMAAPLLRAVAPGLLGLWWFIGPPGSMKDFMAEICIATWEASVLHPVRASFDISETEDLEQKRTFFGAGGAVYGRGKEAAKRIQMINQLIRYAGTPRLPARGMNQDEILIPNRYTYVAESAEDMPARKEIARRTVQIRLLGRKDDEVAHGTVRREIIERAADIIAGLKRRVEEKPASWYLEQKDTKTRPVVPVALARLFGATLEEVKGRDLDELWDNIVLYKKSFALGEGDRELAKARKKDGVIVNSFSTYRFGHFIEEMEKQEGSRAFFREFNDTNKLTSWLIGRESGYSQKVTNDKASYFRVVVGGTPYAFKVVKDGRNFVFEEELVYCNRLKIRVIGPSPEEEEDEERETAREKEEASQGDKGESEESPPADSSSRSTTDKAEAADKPWTATDDDLLDEDEKATGKK